jgi:hypothetical protein
MEITKDARRQLILRALTSYMKNAALAREYGVSRTRVQQYLRDVKEDPEGALEEARREYVFRMKVRQILRGQPYGGE